MAEKIRILYVDDEPDNLLTFKLSLRSWFDIEVASRPSDALDLVRDAGISVFITDQRMPEMSGLDLVQLVKKMRPDLSVMVLTAYDDSEVMREAISLGGIFRVVLKPWSIGDLKQTILGAHEAFLLRKENNCLVHSLEEKNAKLRSAFDYIAKLKDDLEHEKSLIKDNHSKLVQPGEIIGESRLLRKVLNEVGYVAKTDSSVLLIGETGTGKELFARMLHKQSYRREEVMVSINCASIPEALVESELFGYEKGAFSGAFSTKFGKFEVANGGTLFLDEIGELPMMVQSKLLRVLQEKEFERLGGNKTISTDFRLVSATNRDLLQEIQKGNFRSDLYFRVNTIPIVVPPLRKRLEDLPLLVDFFVEQLNRRTGKVLSIVPDSTIEKLCSYHWPGNVRELSNVVERAHVLSRGNTLIVGDGFKAIAENRGEVDELVPLKDVERRHIVKVLEFTNWKIRGEHGAARILGLHPNTLDSRLKKLGLSKSR